MKNSKKEKTIDIESSGENVVIDLEGRDSVELTITGDGSADYRIDGRATKTSTWEEGVRSDLTGSANYQKYYDTAWHQFRVYCTSGTASANDTADIVMCAA
jgi:hypothetical protein